MNKNNKCGFTLIEIMVVVVIMGLMMGLVTMNLDSMTPSSRLEASTRSISSIVNLGMSHAVMSGKPTKLRYNISKGYYELYITNEKDKFESMEKKFVSRGVSYKDVDVAGDRKYREGWVEIEISPLGILAGHVIHLNNDQNEETTIEVNPLSGVVTIKQGYYKMDFVEKL
ncbi:Tfp pilus assembly protein FimT/FimU [Candidatus Uabimicrobium sp. HlEnr_7]|uniref:Tfp pilus assembly protein FimT/FimU n=1 Tax=Candidatus Uabimicrobium helgolandensis TaxID=3095367 RepID=UPI0035566235